jgi:tetratricopeptide (TPR) repeat protein
MFTRILSVPIVLAAAAALSAGGSTTITTVVPSAALEPGIGAVHRKSIDEVVNLVNQKDWANADMLCDKVIAEFQKLMTDPRVTYLAFANKAEFEHFKKTNPRLYKVEWLDHAYGEALHRKAFIAAAQAKYAEGLKHVRNEIANRPYAAIAQTEHGFILNKLGRPHEALEAYEKAAELSVLYASNRPAHAMSLRGVGFSLIELGRLDDASAAFERSLKIEPNNKLAMNELEYIRKLKQKKQPK